MARDYGKSLPNPFGEKTLGDGDRAHSGRSKKVDHGQGKMRPSFADMQQGTNLASGVDASYHRLRGSLDRGLD